MLAYPDIHHPAATEAHSIDPIAAVMSSPYAYTPAPQPAQERAVYACRPNHRIAMRASCP